MDGSRSYRNIVRETAPQVLEWRVNEVNIEAAASLHERAFTPTPLYLWSGH
jgi:hypothetical protein